jgi:DUF4097 and DUF4098 domain-containing protein YvlB
MKAIGAILILGLAAAPALAQTKVDEKRPAAKDARIEIENLAGSVKVIAWKNAEVQVTGTLGPDVEELEFSGGPDRLRIHPELAGGWLHGHSWKDKGVQSDLEVRVPEAAELRIEVVAASVTTEGLTGRLNVESVNGSITVKSGSAVLELESVNGAINIDGAAQRVQAESVNGSVSIRMAGGSLEAGVVSGSLDVSGGSFSRAELESVSGSIRFAGALQPTGSLDLQTVSGGVEVELPSGQGADVSISTFSGGIKTDFEAPAPEKTSRYTPEKELRFKIGAGGSRIEIETLSGSVNVRKAGK